MSLVPASTNASLFKVAVAKLHKIQHYRIRLTSINFASNVELALNLKGKYVLFFMSKAAVVLLDMSGDAEQIPFVLVHFTKRVPYMMYTYL